MKQTIYLKFFKINFKSSEYFGGDTELANKKSILFILNRYVNGCI